MADQLDDSGAPVIQRMLQTARSDGEGYYRYSWRRMQDDEPTPKLSCFRDFPEWGFVLGTGVYLDNVEADQALSSPAYQACARRREQRLIHSGPTYADHGASTATTRTESSN